MRRALETIFTPLLLSRTAECRIYFENGPADVGFTRVSRSTRRGTGSSLKTRVLHLYAFPFVAIGGTCTRVLPKQLQSVTETIRVYYVLTAEKSKKNTLARPPGRKIASEAV